MKPDRILDFHAHLPAKTGIAKRVLHPLVKAYAKDLKDLWREMYDFPEPEKKQRGIQAQGERWAAEVQNNHLEKIVFMTGGGNKVLSDIVRQHPQEFMGFAHHDLCAPNAVEEMEHALDDLGLSGYKCGAGYYQDLLHLAWSSPNVYIDSSGSNDWIRWMPQPLSLKDLFARALETIGPKRIIFGTDSSWFPRGWSKKYFDLQTQVCTELGVSQEEMNAIFYYNGATLLGLEK